jgi:hypothetical protein
MRLGKGQQLMDEKAEYAKQVLDAAWATVERIDNMPKREPVVDDPGELRQMAQLLDVVPVKQFIRPVGRERGLDMQQEKEPNWDGWNGWLDTRVSAILNKFNEDYSKTVIELMFGRMDKHKKAAETEINQLKTEVTALRGEVNLLRELLKGNVKDITTAIRKDIA